MKSLIATITEAVRPVTEANDPNKEAIIRQITDITDPDGDGETYKGELEDLLKKAEQYGPKFMADVQKLVDMDGGHYGRNPRDNGHDKLAHRYDARITKGGKANKQDVSALKTKIKWDKTMGGHGKSKLPEAAENTSFASRLSASPRLVPPPRDEPSADMSVGKANIDRLTKKIFNKHSVRVGGGYSGDISQDVLGEEELEYFVEDLLKELGVKVS